MLLKLVIFLWHPIKHLDNNVNAPAL